MATPLILGTEPPPHYSDHVAGCLVILIAVTAMAEIARPVRFLNVALGLSIAASPVLLAGRREGRRRGHRPCTGRAERRRIAGRRTCAASLDCREHPAILLVYPRREKRRIRGHA